MEKPAERQCKRCGEPGILGVDFYRNRGNYFYWVCKRCTVLLVEEYQKTPKGKAVRLKSWRTDWKKRDCKKVRARAAVKRAIRCGKLVKSLCACGADAVEAHHEDYSKPLQVIWECHGCHTLRHRTSKYG